MNKLVKGTLAALALGVAAPAALADNVCICVNQNMGNYCGNGYIGANPGQYFLNQPNMQLFLDPTSMQVYNTQGWVTSPVSGWTCSVLKR